MRQRQKALFLSLLLLLGLLGGPVASAGAFPASSKGSGAQVLGCSTSTSHALWLKAENDDDEQASIRRQLRSGDADGSDSAEAPDTLRALQAYDIPLGTLSAATDNSYSKYKLETLSSRAHPPTL